MKKILILIFIPAFFIAQSQETGKLTGAPTSSKRTLIYFEGMSLVPMGSYSCLRIPGDSTTKVTCSVQAFYMSQEVTNKEYREYTEWLKAHPDDTLSWLYIDKKAPAEGYKYDSTTERRMLKRYPYIKIINVLTRDIKPIDLSVWEEFKGENCYELYKNYFTDPAFDNFPVVGVSWENARLYCVWKTKMLNKKAEENGDSYLNDVRLPTLEEWEYAVSLGLTGKEKPIIKEIKLKNGNVMINQIDLFPTISGRKNTVGLYYLDGNIAEWTSYAYDEATYTNPSYDLNPSYVYEAKPDDPPALKRKLVTGKSWFNKKGGLQSEYQDKARAFIGFRYVVTWSDGTSVAY